MKLSTIQRVAKAALLPALLAASGLAQANPVQIVHKYMAAWNAHNYNQAALSLDYDVEYFDASVGTSQFGIMTARDNVIKFFMQALPDLKWKMEGKPIVQGDNIAFRWVFTGTNTGIPFECEKPTGKAIELHGVSMINTKGGRIVYQGDFYDAKTLRDQLGLAPTCPAPAAAPAAQ
ncbi:ester cyclase [Curvibacter sp. APW13]|uniref:ester cyclase n=1 Tax=Curvibacter sp. APW13 TaxID=3077236 RepID=UPI0028E07D53|nr:ester cyclase [Curvibacter sp. APW13]MDT8991301.1 ester cyclase [Curvibacter sp. APW13]